MPVVRIPPAAAAIDEREFKALTFCQTIKARTFNRADVNEDVFAATFLLDEAEALGGIEKLYGTGSHWLPPDQNRSRGPSTASTEIEGNNKHPARARGIRA